MKLQKYDSQVQRKILTGMIAHDGILGSIHSRLKGERFLFNQRWLDLVARWCLEHFDKYHKAPRFSVLDRFAKYAQQGEEDNVSLIEKFLDNLGRDFKSIRRELNEDYIVDLALQQFRSVRLQRMADEISDALENKDLEKAEEAHRNYRQIESQEEQLLDPISKEPVFNTFNQMKTQEELITFRGRDGSLHRFLSPNMKRGDFVSFAGPEKRGKSYWLQEVAFQALLSKRRVLYYVLGDMSKNEVCKRLYSRITRKPWRECELKIPRRMLFDDGKLAGCKYRFPYASSFPAITKMDVLRARKKILMVTARQEIGLKLYVGGGSTVAASGIESQIERLTEREGWMPDVVVIDYADLLDVEPGTGREDFRHRINATWSTLRRIALERHCLVLTATQASASSYDKKWVLTKKDFSEDKRKNAHVTGMLGINQTMSEKEHGIYRLNWIVLRDGHWSENQVVWTAGNLALANPAIISAFSSGK